MADQLMGSLEDCLISIQHHDQGTRRSGEILFHQFQSHVDYVEVVTHFASDVNKPAHFRQLVILLLNQQIGKDWRSFSQTSKASLIQFSFDGCNDQINIIRTACMHMLSKIVSRSLETEIKEVLTYLCGLLSMPDIQVITSTLKCLCVIADEVDHESLIELIRLCYVKIQEIMLVSATTNPQALRYSSKLLRICIQKFGAARMACGLDEGAVTMIEQFLPSWLALVTQTFASIHSVAEMISKLGVILELLRSVTLACEAFPDDCEASFSDLMRISWGILCLIRDHDESAHLNQSSRQGYNVSGTDSGYTSDGDRVDLEVLVIQLFELLTIGLSTSAADAKSFLGGDLDQVISLLVGQMQLSAGQQEQWESDGNEFVASEQEEFCEFSVRHSGAELLSQICKGGKERAFGYMFRSENISQLQRFSDTNLLVIGSIAVDVRAVLSLESVMWCVGCLGVSYMKHVRLEEKYRKRTAQSTEDSLGGGSAEGPKGKESAAIAVISLIPRAEVARVVSLYAHTVLIGPLKRLLHPSHAVLRGRAVWLVSTFTQLFDTAFIEVICEACIRIMDPSHSLSARLQSCQALAVILSKSYAHTTSALVDSTSTSTALFCTPGKGQTFALSVIDSALSLLPLMNQSTLHYALELVSLVVKRFLDPLIPSNASAQVPVALITSVARIVQAGMKVLSTYSTDPFLLNITKDLLIAFSKASNFCLLTVNQHCIPQLSVWLMHCNGGVEGNRSHTEGSSDTPDSGTGSGSFYVPPSLVDVSIDIVCALCLSPTLSSCSTAQEPAEIVLSCLRILLSSLSASGHPCRREGMQAINLIFSHYQGKILDFFTPNRLTPSGPIMTVESFSIALAELILFALKGFEADGGVSGDCSGAVAGLLCHLLNNFKNFLDVLIVNSLLSATLQCIRSTSSCYVKSSLLMGLIHLFARNTALLANSTSPLLGTLSPKEPGGKAESALGYVLEEWCSLHVHLESKYSGTISTLGFLELIKMFNMHAGNHGFALKVLQLTLMTLPRILLNTDDEGDVEGMSPDDRDENSDDSDNEEWESEEEDGEYDDNMDEDDFVGMDGIGGTGDTVWKKKNQDPFAPAEMYLSDMIGSPHNGHHGNDDENQGDYLLLNVSSSLVFSPPRLDPLANVDLQGVLIELLKGLKSRDGKGLYPTWMNGLTVKEQHLVEALFESR